MIEQEKYNLEDLPRRKTGNKITKFKTTQIISNYFPVSIKSFEKIYIFKVVFNPQLERDNRAKRLVLLNQAMPTIKNQIQNPVIGGMNIYSGTEPLENQVEHEAGGYKILIKLVKSFSMKNPGENKMLLHFLNNGIRNILTALNFIQIGKTGKYFYQGKKLTLFNQLSIYSGFNLNFVVGKGGLYLRVDPTKKMVQNKTVLDFIDQIYRRNSGGFQEKRQSVKQALIGKIVMTNYGKTRYLKIEDIQFPILSEVMIPGQKKMNILQYFKQKYDIEVKPSTTHRPLLKMENKNKKDTNPIYILPQVCLMTGLPSDIDEGRRKQITAVSIKEPHEKLKQITDFVNQIKKSVHQKQFIDLGIKIQNQPQRINGIKIQNPTIKLGNKDTIRCQKATNFQIFQNILNAEKSLQLTIFYFREDSIIDFQRSLKQSGKNFGLKFEIKTRCIAKTNNLQQSVLFEVQKAINKKNCNCALIVLQNYTKNYYKSIKKHCLQKFKIITQVVLENTLKKKNTRAIPAKIMLQMAAKIGNTLWAPDYSTQVNNSMLLSFDTSKSGGVRKIIGVCTLDSNMARIASQSITLNEISDKFNCMVKISINLLAQYVNRKQKMPKRLIIVTNSCPKNEVKMYFDYFIPQIKMHLGDTKLIIVQAKDLSSERFFSKLNDGTLTNPTTGLLIKDKIVSNAYDFYLVSQRPTIGCTVPIHFNVISSNEQLQEGVLEELLYHQCFGYANWSGSIKIPAIMQYAKKFARFSSEVLQQSNIQDKELNRKPYFI